MFKKSIILCVLILSLCTAVLTSCGNNNMASGTNDSNGERVTETPIKPNNQENETTQNDARNNGIVGGMVNGAENAVDDIRDSITHPEYATHGKENESPVENQVPAGEKADSAKHKRYTDGK